jgi:hypothetical protein
LLQRGSISNEFDTFTVDRREVLALINWSMIRLGGRWKLMGAVALTAILIRLLAGVPAALSIPFAFTGVGFPVGFITLRLWMIVMGVTMFRWRPVPT